MVLSADDHRTGGYVILTDEDLLSHLGSGPKTVYLSINESHAEGKTTYQQISDGRARYSQPRGHGHSDPNEE